MKVSTPLHVRFSDIDVMGHVNNAVYLSYFEQGRIGFSEAYLSKEWDWKRNGIVLARNEVDYKKPLLLQDKPSIETWVEAVGGKSLTFAYTIKDDSGSVFATGRSVLVCFDYAKGISIEVPDIWRSLVDKP